ncbi:MAG: HNH endonuclease [Gammaproteobacteria bacterium]|nr:HNH endonuclease [Gammaproteobacteria bacterium]
MPLAPPTHKPPGHRTRQQYQRDLDARRGTTAERGYGSRWRSVRAVHLQSEPLCRFCAACGHVKAAHEVDHVDGDSGNNAAENLRSLCKSCHSRRTASEQGFARRR